MKGFTASVEGNKLGNPLQYGESLVDSARVTERIKTAQFQAPSTDNSPPTDLDNSKSNSELFFEGGSSE